MKFEAFGDVDEDNEINDLVITDNGDRNLIKRKNA
jgi:hypothetical protein